MKTLFIINPKAGRGTTLSRWNTFEPILKRYANFPFEVHFTTHVGEAETIASQATDAEFRRVVAVGGDGTVNEVINGALGSNIVVGLLPFGTGNDLSRSMTVGKSNKDLLNMLCSPQEASVNVAQINDRYFINAAGVGFDGMVANHINRHVFFKSLGAIGYVLSAVSVLTSFVPSEVILNIDGRSISLSHVWMIAIANCPFYGGGMKICPNAKYDDDVLDVCIVSDLGKVGFFKILPTVYSGRHIEKDRFIHTLQGKHIEIHCPNDMIAHADGELMAASSIKVNMTTKRIRFLRG